jgi:hypothetical protein
MSHNMTTMLFTNAVLAGWLTLKSGLQLQTASVFYNSSLETLVVPTKIEYTKSNDICYICKQLKSDPVFWSQHEKKLSHVPYCCLLERLSPLHLCNYPIHKQQNFYARFAAKETLWDKTWSKIRTALIGLYSMLWRTTYTLQQHGTERTM